MACRMFVFRDLEMGPFRVAVQVHARGKGGGGFMVGFQAQC